jgi:hypothetical protein
MFRWKSGFTDTLPSLQPNLLDPMTTGEYHGMCGN